jgi:Formyl transferase
MLRCVFVGSPNRFTELMVHWLSKHSILTGVVWTYSAHWAKSFSGRLQFAQKRLKRFGFMKTANETLYYLLSKNFLNESGEPFQSRLCEAYSHQYGEPTWHGESIETRDINAPEVLSFLRERSPDLIMSMCINEFFRKEIRTIPRLGAFLWHEGLVPEYKGLYSPFWAIHNGEPQMLGYTVLRMNARYDEGEVFLQDRVTGINVRTDSPLYIGHKAILDSLPHVANLFEELEKGTARPMAIEGRESGYYTYPGLTDWLRYRKQTLTLEVPQQAEMKPALRAETMRDRI